jgi:methionine biosynthesis protein MetW
VKRIAIRFRELTRISELWGPAPLHDFHNYDEYWLRRQSLNTLHSRWKIAGELIADDSSVLDIGCGSGEFLRYLKESRPLCEVEGIDTSAEACRLTASRGIECSVHDIASCDLDRAFDYITCLEVIEHIPDAEAVLHRIMTSCRRSAIISIPNVGFIGCRIRLCIFGRFPRTLCVCHMAEHVRFWTLKDFREWISHYGYFVIKERPQHGVWGLWKLFPGLFASGMVFEVCRDPLGVLVSA